MIRFYIYINIKLTNILTNIQVSSAGIELALLIRKISVITTKRRALIILLYIYYIIYKLYSIINGFEPLTTGHESVMFPITPDDFILYIYIHFYLYRCYFIYASTYIKVIYVPF